MLRKRLPFAMILMMWFFPQQTMGLEITGDIEGVVVDGESGQTLAGAKIKIKKANIVVTSDRNGCFRLSNVPTGTYDIEISTTGYESVVKRGIVVLAGETIFLNVGLQEEIATVYTLDEIVVTATRMRERTVNIDGSVSIINEGFIERIPAANVVDIIDFIPGFQTYSTDGNDMKPGVNIRGFTGGGLAEYLLVLVDGLPINDLETGLVNWNLVPVDKIKRIEVLRGPSSALYGDMALGGVINIMTEGSESSSLTEISVEGGSYGDYGGTLNLTLVSGRTTYDVFASEQRRDGWREHSRWRGETLSGKMRLPVGGDWQLSVSSLNQWISSQTPGPLTLDQLHEDRAQSTLPLDKENQQRHLLFANCAREEVGKWRFESGLFFKYKADDIYRTLFLETKEQVKDTYACGLSSQYSHVISWKEIDQYLVLGTGLEWGEMKSSYYDLSADGKQAEQPSTKGSGTRGEIACYFQNKIVPIEQVSLTLGLRWDGMYDDYDDEFHPIAQFNSDKSAFSTKIGANWKFSQRGRIYANLSRAFKAPTMEQLFDQRPFFDPYQDGFRFISNTELKPQKGTNYEIGVNRQFGSLVEANVSLYQINMEDEIDFDLSTLKYVNIGRSQHRGIESEMQLYPFASINSFVNYTYTEAKYASGEHEGQQINNIPYHLIHVGLLLKSDLGLRAGIIINSVKDQYMDGANEHPLPDYSTCDFRMSYEREPVNISVDFRNVLNRTYSSYGYIDPLTNQEMFFPAPGRSVRGNITITL